MRKPGPIPDRLANQKPPGELGKKENKCVEKREGIERLALTRIRKMPLKLTPPRPMLTRPEKPRKKPNKKLNRKFQRRDVRTVSARGMLPKSRTIIVIRKVIIPSIAPSQMTSGV